MVRVLKITLVSVLCMLMCTASAEWSRAPVVVSFGAGTQMLNEDIGSDPIGIIQVSKPIYCFRGASLSGSYLHISSIPDSRDLATVDSFNLFLNIPITRYPERYNTCR